MNDYFSDEQIINQLCKERIKLVERRDDRQYLTRFIGCRSPSAYPDELDELLPPRRQWNAFRPRHRSENGDADLKALRAAVNILRERNPDLPWACCLNQFIFDIRERVFGPSPFYFARPTITWLHKKENEYRALCKFPLQDNVIASLFALYLRDQFDSGFSCSSYAFRSRNSSGQMPTHHDAFNALFGLKHGRPNKEFYVAEVDIRGFFDTVDHAVARIAFDRAERRLRLHPRAREIFMAYLNCYNFPVNVLQETEPRLKQNEGELAHFHWPEDVLENPESRVLGVPQGGAISGIIANLILDAADKAVEEVRNSLGAEIHYYRYCDDMILLSPVKKHCQAALEAYLNKLDELKLPYHKPERTIIYGQNHWNHKSKAVYCWSGRKWFGCVPWIQFVGYQIRYDSLVRARKGAFAKQAEKFVEVTDRVKFGLLRASRQGPIIASRFQAMRSFAHKLTAKGVGRVDTYSEGPRPMSWSAGFKALHLKPIVPTDLKHLDSLRQKQILRFADAQINYGPGRRRHGEQGWNPVGCKQSYVAQFRNLGGQELIDNPWRPENWKEWVMAKIFVFCKWMMEAKKKMLARFKYAKKRIVRAFRKMPAVYIGETWADTKFRRDKGVWEVLEVKRSLVKCRNFHDQRIRYLTRIQFGEGRRYTKLEHARPRLTQ